MNCDNQKWFCICTNAIVQDIISRCTKNEKVENVGFTIWLSILVNFKWK